MDGALAWLMGPLTGLFTGAAPHSIAPWAAWHARCMVLAWAVLLPLGVLAARFFKITPGQRWPQVLDNPAWWHAHRALNYTGVALVAVGLLIAWGHAGSSDLTAQLHGWLGWLLSAAAALQIAGGLLRGSKGGPTDAQARGDHYDMTPRRMAFERLHKRGGWLALVVAVAVIGLGLVVADAPRWMALVLTAWWLLLLAAFVALQRSGRCLDTYQAIWGPGVQHPGNRLPVSGWGVRRPGAGLQTRPKP